MIKKTGWEWGVTGEKHMTNREKGQLPLQLMPRFKRRRRRKDRERKGLTQVGEEEQLGAGEGGNGEAVVGGGRGGSGVERKALQHKQENSLCVEKDSRVVGRVCVRRGTVWQSHGSTGWRKVLWSLSSSSHSRSVLGCMSPLCLRLLFTGRAPWL